jgi:hypothetical protein
VIGGVDARCDVVRSFASGRLIPRSSNGGSQSGDGTIDCSTLRAARKSSRLSTFRRNRRFLGEEEIDAAYRSLEAFRLSERHSTRLADGSRGIGVQVVDGVGHYLGLRAFNRIGRVLFRSCRVVASAMAHINIRQLLLHGDATYQGKRDSAECRHCQKSLHAKPSIKITRCDSHDC